MGLETKVIKNRLGLLSLAEELGNVSRPFLIYILSVLSQYLCSNKIYEYLHI